MHIIVISFVWIIYIIDLYVSCTFDLYIIVISFVWIVYMIDLYVSCTFDLYILCYMFHDLHCFLFKIHSL